MSNTTEAIAAIDKRLGTIRVELDRDKTFKGALGALGQAIGAKADFPDVLPFEVGVRDYLRDYKVAAELYHHVDYMPLLDSGLEFLLRALSFREDGKNLSLRAANELVEAFKARTDLDAGKANLRGPSQTEIQSQQSYIDSLEALKKKLEPHLKKAPAKAEDLRLMMDYETVAANLEKAKAAKSILEQRFQLAQLNLQNAELVLEALGRRKATAGHALNSEERIKTAKQAFLQNIAEAYVRLRLSAQGLRQVFGASSFQSDFADGQARYKDMGDSTRFAKFPAIDSDGVPEVGFVDRLVAWTRDSLFVLDRINKGVQEVRLLFSLATLFAKGEAKQLHLPDGYEVTLKDTHFSNLYLPRLTGVGLHLPPVSFTASTNADEYKKRHASRRAIIRMPQQASSSGQLVDVPKLCFGDVRPFDDRADNSLASPAFQNSNPLGKWSVFLGRSTHSEVAVAPLTDLWLELTVWGFPTDGNLFCEPGRPIKSPIPGLPAVTADMICRLPEDPVF